MDIFSAFADFYFKYLNPVLDIGLLTVLLYLVYQFILRTNGFIILRSSIVLIVFGLIVYILKLEVLSWILKTIMPVLLISFAIIFQPEIRKIFLKLGQVNLLFTKPSEANIIAGIVEVLKAAVTLSNMKRGMLVVFPRDINSNGVIEGVIASGQKIDADVTENLLVTIFGHDTPMHDGAAIIDVKNVKKNKIVAAGCFLPISNQYDIKKTYGTRHRAALGLSEQCDAIILVVSEETGAISLAYDAQLHYDLVKNGDTKNIQDILKKKLGVKE